MKTLLTILLLTLGARDIEKMTYEDFVMLPGVEIELNYFHFDATDTSLTYQLSATIDTLGIVFEKHHVSKRYDLKSVSDRAELRGNAITEPALSSLGNLLYNQFTNF